MAKFKTETEEENGWCRWVPPLMQGYRMACCDCGLVHDMEYRVVKVKRTRTDGTWEHGEPLDPAKYRVMFRAKRNNRSTGRRRKSCKSLVVRLNRGQRSAPPHGSALDCGMPNITAYKLGLIASEVGNLGADKAGDEIDRGLILVRRLQESGYSVVPNDQASK